MSWLYILAAAVAAVGALVAVWTILRMTRQDNEAAHADGPATRGWSRTGKWPVRLAAVFVPAWVVVLVLTPDDAKPLVAGVLAGAAFLCVMVAGVREGLRRRRELDHERAHE